MNKMTGNNGNSLGDIQAGDIMVRSEFNYEFNLRN